MCFIVRKRLCYALLKAAKSSLQTFSLLRPTWPDTQVYTVTIVRDLTVNIDASFKASFSVHLIGKFPCHFITRTDLTRLLACSLCFYEGKVHSTHKSSVMLHPIEISEPWIRMGTVLSRNWNSKEIYLWPVQEGSCPP